MELPTEKISHVDIRMEGLNGQLPNLDLVNLAHRLFQQERFVTTLKDRVSDSLTSRSNKNCNFKLSRKIQLTL